VVWVACSQSVAKWDRLCGLWLSGGGVVNASGELLVVAVMAVVMRRWIALADDSIIVLEVADCALVFVGGSSRRSPLKEVR
jgi:hypothetical protein